MNMNEQPEGFNPDTFDALVRNYEKMGQFEGKSQFSSWVTRIAINQALTCLRKRGRVKFVSVDEELGDGEGPKFLDLPELRPDPEQCYRGIQCQKLLRNAISEIPRTCQEAFLLYQSEDKSLEEIARRLGVSVPAVKSRLLRAKLLLRKKLSKPVKVTRDAGLDWLFLWPELAL
jgi:RNA polymerase sigma-70 factor (ECF subfamily)